MKTTVYVGNTPVEVTMDHDPREDALVAGFIAGDERQRRMGVRLDEKRGRRNAARHPGWKHIMDNRAAVVLAGYGYGTKVLAQVKADTRARYGNPQRDLTRARKSA